MGINKFIYLLLVATAIVLFYEKDTKVVHMDNEEKPEISFITQQHMISQQQV